MKRTTRVAAAALTAGAVALAMAGIADAAAKPHAKFAVTKLSIVNYKAKVDVAKTPATVRAQIQVKDFDKKFDPKTVKLVVTDKAAGTPVTTFTVNASLVGRSKVVSNWKASIVVPKGGVDPGKSVVYCISLVKVDDASPATLPVVALAKGLVGRDCFTVVNTAKA